MSRPLSRRHALGTLAGAALSGVALAAPLPRPFMRTSNKSGLGPVVVGSGDHTYECLHDWAKTPADIVQRAHAEITTCVNDPQVRGAFRKMGYEDNQIVADTPATARIMAAITAILEEIRGETAPAERFDLKKHRESEQSTGADGEGS